MANNLEIFFDKPTLIERWSEFLIFLNWPANREVTKAHVTFLTIRQLLTTATQYAHDPKQTLLADLLDSPGARYIEKLLKPPAFTEESLRKEREQYFSSRPSYKCPGMPKARKTCGLRRSVAEVVAVELDEVQVARTSLLQSLKDVVSSPHAGRLTPLHPDSRGHHSPEALLPAPVLQFRSDGEF